MDNLRIITTEDGSHTLYNHELKETYHSTHGALQESNYVFIKNGLEFFEQSIKPEATSVQGSAIKIFEVGFGTGLNAALSMRYAEKNDLEINYLTIEPFPLSTELLSKLNYGSLGLDQVFKKLHSFSYGQKHKVSDNFRFESREESLQEVQLSQDTFDVIYYDAFAPGKQPELWDISCFKKIVKCMKQGSVFVTYCAKGQLKRDLASLGLEVESLPGPPGKREMVRAMKL